MDDGKLLRFMKSLVTDFRVIKKSHLLLLTKEPLERSKQMLRLLLNEQKVFEVGDDYIASSPNEAPSDQIDKAMTVLQMLLTLIDPCTVSAEFDEDLILTFLYEDKIYEVLCRENDQKPYKRLEPGTGYVVVLDSLEEADTVDIGLCDSVLFAVIDENLNGKLYEVR